ncbi:MAG: TonB-dependent receptor [Gammaproteobacteria bacterium]|nr:TonB-dependent receptor [Gammaproteobacteria bacterium]
MSNFWRSRGRLGIAAFAAIGVTFGLPAAAQSDEEEGGSLVEEIVVTATYRDTQLMDTPMTISALTDVDIEQRGVEDIKNLFLAIPGLNYGNATQTWHRITARGVAQFRAPTGPIAMYVDNTPVKGTGSRAPLLPNFDLERIEVLKGPQGSLYGEGSMVGAIRYITKKPNPEGFSYGIQARFEDSTQSDDLGHRIDAMVNIPLGDRLAARITPFHRYKAGVIDKVGPAIIKDVDFVGDQGYRAQLAFYPSDTLTITGAASYVYADIGGPGIGFHCYKDWRPAAGNLAPGDFVPSIPNYPVIGGCESGPNGGIDGETGRFKDGPDSVYVTHMASPDFDDGGESDSWIYNITAELQLGWADLTLSSSSYEHNITYAEEQRVGGRFGTIRITEEEIAAGVAGGNALITGSVEGDRNSYNGWNDRVDRICAELDPPCGPGGFWARSSVRAHSDLNEITAHEVRLVSTTESRLQWSIGAYFQDVYKPPDPRLAQYCGATGHNAEVSYGGPQYPDVKCRHGGFTFNPNVMTPDQMREVHRRTLGTRQGSSTYQFRDEQAVFGEASYRLSDQLEILAGVRYAESSFETYAGPGGAWHPFENTRQQGETQTQEKAAPKFTLTWRPNDSVMVYGTWATAFRSGGVNTRLSGQVTIYEELAAQGVARAAELADAARDLLTFEGDDIETLELGIKTTVWDGRLDLTLNVYDTAIDNAVVTTSVSFPALVDPANPDRFQPYDFSVTDNVGQAKSRGVEFEGRGQLTDAISLHFGGAWVPDAETLAQETGAPIGGGARSVNIDPGNRIELTPVLSYFASAMYDFELFGRDATLRGDVYHRGKEVFRTQNNERPTPTYTFLNLKLTLREDNVSYGFYVKNVFDAIGIYAVGDSGYHGFNPPRAYGFEFNYTP